MSKVESKIVVFPKNEDLFSLRNKRMISRGPAGPILLDIGEIYTVLNQANRPLVQEVVVLRIDKYPTPKKIYSEPVTLTLQNYDLSYEEITGIDLGRVETVTQVAEKLETAKVETVVNPVTDPITDTVVETLEPVETVETVEPVETVEVITDAVETIETVENVEPIETVEVIEDTVTTTENVEVLENVETIETVEVIEGSTDENIEDTDDENDDEDETIETSTAPATSNRNHKKGKR